MDDIRPARTPVVLDEPVDGPPAAQRRPVRSRTANNAVVATAGLVVAGRPLRIGPALPPHQVLGCTTPALGIRFRSRSAYASARSRIPAGLLPTVGADLMIALRTASRAWSLRL